MKTYLVVPAWSDQAGQCRIVSREGRHPEALRSYREAPELWAEAGLMNSRGRVVCLDDADLFEQMRADEPLSAGVVYVADGPAEEMQIGRERSRA